MFASYPKLGCDIHALEVVTCQSVFATQVQTEGLLLGDKFLLNSLGTEGRVCLQLSKSSLSAGLRMPCPGRVLSQVLVLLSWPCSASAEQWQNPNSFMGNISYFGPNVLSLCKCNPLL